MLSHTISFSLSLNLHYLRIFNKDPNANRLYNHSIRACEKGKGLQRSFNPLALQIFSHYQDRRQMIRQDLGWVFTSYLTITMPHSPKGESALLTWIMGVVPSCDSGSLTLRAVSAARKSPCALPLPQPRVVILLEKEMMPIMGKRLT